MYRIHNVVNCLWSKTWKVLFVYSWPPFIIVGETVHFCLGIWGPEQHRSQLMWLAPGYLHFVVSAASVALLLRSCSNIIRCKKWNELFCFVCWTTTNLVALVLSIVGAVYCWEAQHLIQCLSCMVLTWEYLVVKWVVDEWVKRFGSQALTSQDASATNPRGQRTAYVFC